MTRLKALAAAALLLAGPAVSAEVDEDMLKGYALGMLNEAEKIVRKLDYDKRLDLAVCQLAMVATIHIASDEEYRHELTIAGRNLVAEACYNTTTKLMNSIKE